MNISTYLPDNLIRALDQLARDQHVSRSAVIREAVENYLLRFQAGAWPDDVLSWQGDPEFPPFESLRGADDTVARDPFETPPTP